MIKNLIVTIFLISLGNTSQLFSRDPCITQFSNMPLYYNPAYTGLFNGLHIRFSTRTENPELNTSLRSYHLSADIADRNLPGAGGIGLILNKDNDGLGFINNYNLGVSYSVRIPFTYRIIGQAGIKAAWLRKHISWDEFKMSEKLRENYGNIYDSGFIRPDINVINLPDFAIGGVVQFINSMGCISGTVGAAVDHLFEPDVSFLPSEAALLHRKWIGHADLIWSIKCRPGAPLVKNQAVRINPGIVFQHQGAFNSILAGINSTYSGLYFGLYYNGAFGPLNVSSVTMSGGYRYEFAENMSIKFTYSYDKQIAGTQQKTGGAHEISLVLEFTNLKLFKGSGNSSHGLRAIDNTDAHLAYAAF